MEQQFLFVTRFYTESGSCITNFFTNYRAAFEDIQLDVTIYPSTHYYYIEGAVAEKGRSMFIEKYYEQFQVQENGTLESINVVSNGMPQAAFED